MRQQSERGGERKRRRREVDRRARVRGITHSSGVARHASRRQEGEPPNERLRGVRQAVYVAQEGETNQETRRFASLRAFRLTRANNQSIVAVGALLERGQDVQRSVSPRDARAIQHTHAHPRAAWLTDAPDASPSFSCDACSCKNERRRMRQGQQAAMSAAASPPAQRHVARAAPQAQPLRVGRVASMGSAGSFPARGGQPLARAVLSHMARVLIC